MIGDQCTTFRYIYFLYLIHCVCIMFKLNSLKQDDNIVTGVQNYKKKEYPKSVFLYSNVD